MPQKKTLSTPRVAQLDLFEQSNVSTPAQRENKVVSTEAPVIRASAVAVGPTTQEPVAAIETRPVVTLSAGTDVAKDAGVELVANRRNRGRAGYKWDDLAHMNPALRVKECVKHNVWPKPDYEALIAAGTQPLVAHVLKQIYDSISAKPVAARATSVADLQKLYVETIGRIERGVNQWMSDPASIKAWARSNARNAGSMIGRSVEFDAVEGQGRRLLDVVFPDGWREHQAGLRSVGTNKVVGALQPGYEEIRRAIDAIDKGWPQKRESWAVQGYKILERPDIVVEPIHSRSITSFSLMVGKRFVKAYPSAAEAEQAKNAIKPFVLIGKRGFVDSFETEEQAVIEARDRVAKTRTGQGEISDKGLNVALAERVGVSRRLEGEDITSERLMEEFGLKGVNFGNWMKTSSARVEAQLHLNHAFDALHDLAEVLDVPPKALSLGGMLGLAFGAQGRGGENAAHFVPGVNEINLTRTAGAGALAHEWAHGLDHYFARQSGLDSDERPYLSEHAELPAEYTRHKVVDGKMVPVQLRRFEQLRPEMLNAFKSVVLSMTKREQTEEEFQNKEKLALERLHKNINGWLQSIRRDFAGLEPEFDAIAGKIQAGEYGEGRVQVGANTLLFPVVDSLRDLYKSKHGRVCALDPLRGLQSNLDSLAFRQAQKVEAAAVAGQLPAPPTLVTTNYLANANELDRDKGGKPYWSTKCELFARAFDSYIADRLDRKQAQNTYLSFGVRETKTVPVGRERDAIHEAFDAMVGELVVRDSELGPALFSVAPESIPDQGLARVDIEREIERMLSEWKNPPRVKVVGAASDLPFNAPEHADGAYHDGRVYVVAGNIGSLRQVQKVMAHECVLHHSLDEMLGPYGFTKLHHGIEELRARGDATIVALTEEVATRYGELPGQETTKEIVAAAGERCLDETGQIRVEYGFMKGVFAGVTGWLRDHGVSVPFSNAELQGILHNAGQWARGNRDMPLKQLVTDVTNSVIEKSGRFIGRIVGIADGIVSQRVDRAGNLAKHALSALSERPSIGQVADIQYQGGRGQVNKSGHELSIGRD